MRYRAVLFDVGETLIGPREGFGAVYARVLAGLGLELPADRLERALREVSAAVEREIPAGADRYRHFPGGEAEYWRRFAEHALERATGCAPDAALASRALGGLRAAFRAPEAWRVYDDVPPALERLRTAGVRLGVVSNWDSNLVDVLRMLGLDRHFETIGVSHLEGVEKPDPRFFRVVLERMGVAPRDALHVGDRPDMDLAGARAAGVDALLIDRRGRYADADHPRIDDFRGLDARVGLDPGAGG